MTNNRRRQESSDDLRIATVHVKKPAMSRMSDSIPKDHFDDFKRDGRTKGLVVSKIFREIIENYLRGKNENVTSTGNQKR